MQPSRRHCLYASLALLVCLLIAERTNAGSLTITSSPTGATVEIDGLAAGTTPYQTDLPGGYFHKPHTVFSSRLDHSMIVLVSKDGYVSRQVTLSEGPFEWVAISGRHHGTYFLLRSNYFDIKLDVPSQAGGAPVETIDHDGPLRPASVTSGTAGGSFRPDDHATSGVAETGSVAISSDPPGAEIYVDGKFVGQTPSTIQLAGGSHRIEVKSKGRQGWSRNLEVLKDSQLTLHPVLEQSP